MRVPEQALHNTNQILLLRSFIEIMLLSSQIYDITREPHKDGELTLFAFQLFTCRSFEKFCPRCIVNDGVDILGFIQIFKRNRKHFPLIQRWSIQIYRWQNALINQRKEYKSDVSKYVEKWSQGLFTVTSNGLSIAWSNIFEEDAINDIVELVSYKIFTFLSNIYGP